MDLIRSEPTQLIVKPNRKEQAGKVGLALLAWMLGVPGSLVLLYLIFF